jgi:hypothetical protein
MQMIPKIVIWGGAFYGTIVLGREVLVPHDMMILVLVTGVLPFFIYLALLYLEIRSRIKKDATQKQIRWAGFYFTFGVGFIWGTAFSSALGHHPLCSISDPSTLFIILFSGIVSGIIVGIVGMAITQFMVLFVFKQPEQV